MQLHMLMSLNISNLHAQLLTGHFDTISFKQSLQKQDSYHETATEASEVGLSANLHWCVLVHLFFLAGCQTGRESQAQKQ